MFTKQSFKHIISPTNTHNLLFLLAFRLSIKSKSNFSNFQTFQSIFKQPKTFPKISKTTIIRDTITVQEVIRWQDRQKTQMIKPSSSPYQLSPICFHIWCITARWKKELCPGWLIRLCVNGSGKEERRFNLFSF